MKKLKFYIIPVMTLILFTAIMTTGGPLKRSFGKNDNVMKYIDNLMSDVKSEKWQQAESDIKYLKRAWEIVKKRVQFSVEKDEMNLIDMNIAKMEGALTIHDKSFFIIELSEMKGHWNELEK